MIAATIVVVFLAFAVDGLFSLVQRALTPRGVQLSGEAHTLLPPTGAEGVSIADLTAERA